jgi:hypothetical protein
MTIDLFFHSACWLELEYTHWVLLADSVDSRFRLSHDLGLPDFIWKKTVDELTRLRTSHPALIEIKKIMYLGSCWNKYDESFRLALDVLPSSRTYLKESPFPWRIDRRSSQRFKDWLKLQNMIVFFPCAITKCWTILRSTMNFPKLMIHARQVRKDQGLHLIEDMDELNTRKGAWVIFRKSEAAWLSSAKKLYG